MSKELDWVFIFLPFLPRGTGAERPRGPKREIFRCRKGNAIFAKSYVILSKVSTSLSVVLRSSEVKAGCFEAHLGDSEAPWCVHPQ